MTVSTGVGVAIATRDRPQALARCLASLAAGRVHPAEVVVADQSSGSATREVVAAAEQTGMALRYVDGGKDGLAGAQNAAFRHATAPTVAVIDDDCVADPAWVAELERLFAADPGLALIGGRVLALEPAGDRRYPVSSRTGAHRAEFQGNASPWLIGSGNNFALRRAWFERIGGCDLRLGPGAPGQGALDMDLFYRVLHAGGRARYEPGVVVFHERATRRGRMDRRWPYGHGMGAMCMMRLMEGDLFALRLLVRWTGLRGRLAASALVRRRWDAILEEALMLAGTAAGIGHAVRRRSRPRGGGNGR